MKPRLAICCIALAAKTAFAYWMPTPIEELTAQSDCVVIGRVKHLLPDTNTHRVLVTMEDLIVLKGKGISTAVTFDAPYTMYCDTSFIMNGQRVILLNSFATNQSCAVFLKYPRENSSNLAMTMDCDGKFDTDWPPQHLKRSVFGKMADDGINALSVKEFLKKVDAAPLKLYSVPQLFPATATPRVISPASSPTARVVPSPGL